MNTNQKKKTLHDFLKSRVWQRTIINILDEKIGCSNYRVIDNKGEIALKKEAENAYCQAVKTQSGREIQCRSSISEIMAKAEETKAAVVEPCIALLLGFAIPLLMENELIGLIHGCQMVDPDLDPAVYQGLVQESDMDEDGFPILLERIPAISASRLKKDVELIHLLSQAFINLITNSQRSLKTGFTPKIIPEFYRIFKLNEDLIFELETEQLYSLLVDLISKSMNAEICSLMLCQPESQEITIKAAVGLSELAVKRTRLKVGEGMVGYVTKEGKPLLIKDVGKVRRFRIKHKPDRYYTKSLIICPLKVGHKSIGVVNVNNEATRRSFNEDDVRLLSILCNYAASAIDASLIAHRKKKSAAEREEIEMAKIKELQQEVEQEHVKIEEQKRELADLRTNSEKLLTLSKLFDEVKDSDELKTYLETLTPFVPAGKEEAITAKLDTDSARLETEGRDLHRLASLKREIDFREKLYEAAIEREDQKTQEIQAEKLEKLRTEAQKIEELRAKAEEFNLLYDVARAISSIQEPKEILRWVLERIQSFFRSHAGAFFLLEGKTLQGEIRPTCPLDDDCLEKLRKKLSQDWLEANPSDRKLRHPRKSIVSVEKGAYEVIASQVKEELASFITVPLKTNHKAIGLINISSLTPHAFTPLDKRIFVIVANQVSLAIERAQFFLEIKEAAEQDELTHVYNYRYLKRFLNREFARAERYKEPLSVIMLDSDGLKKINDQYGHDQGNRVIKHIAKLVQHKVRETDCMARFGGDEFGIVLPATEKKGAITLAERIKESISQHPIKIKGQKCHLTISLGVSAYPDSKIKSEMELLKQADEALYRAKQAGGDKVGS
ncbi:MAG: diguanylate cyclase [bacterium]